MQRHLQCNSKKSRAALGTQQLTQRLILGDNWCFD
jgi:hypothetical protein